MSRPSARQSIRRLYEIRARYGPSAAAEKSSLLVTITGSPIRAAADLRRLHTALCFLRAFPDDARIRRQAEAMLAGFHTLVGGLSGHQRGQLADSGIAGTRLHYAFSFDVASWIARRFPEAASLDWEQLHDPARLEELLPFLMDASETDGFDSATLSTRDWLTGAAGPHGQPFDWLMRQMRGHHDAFAGRVWSALYDAADVPLVCELAPDRLSRTANVLDLKRCHYRREPMRRGVRRAKREIVRPLGAVRLLPREEATQLLDAARASLAVRHRETNHFNGANPGEVYVGSVGRGISIALSGLRMPRRYPLECTLGYLILSNGVPIGYGGASTLFRQVNTGINIFDEYRGAEAAWLWVQVMRMLHAMTGCNRFIANPYQFGADNSEALRSGAFWFYYRLGYRPVEPDIRQLALDESRALASGSRRHTPAPLLRRLAGCDMHLTLAGARRADLFEESWLAQCSALATAQLGACGCVPRREALHATARRVGEALGIDSTRDWSLAERQWFERLSPFVAAIDVSRWSARERAGLVRLMRAKGGPHERDYAKQMTRTPRLFHGLAERCRGLAA